MHRRPCERETEAGTILLPVILLLLLLATAASTMMLQARTSLREASTRRVRASLALAADGAVRATALALATAATGRTAPPFAIDGTPQKCRLAGGRSLTLSVQDEGGRIDLNKATADLLQLALSRAGLSAPDSNAVADAIVARRGPGSTPSPKLRTRSVRSYAGTSPGFALVDSLDDLPALHSGIFDSIRPMFTVSNGSAGIDPAVAAPAIRAVIPTKELTSPVLEAMTTPSNHSDFTIEATIVVREGPRFAREAVLHLDPQAGPLGQFRSWDAPAAYGPEPEAQRDSGFCQRIASALTSTLAD